ncbi:hypothetical protein [Abyssisolibacter fermentans]|uniref:hypothetical protein n=1 Tax=Abyssisolibacter fermentans TaxID=1766203 RepID=UPI00082C07EE|nr:hypothetical protein [Abyssisolibacter fermentans]
MHEDMEQLIEELFNEALMTETPLVIVEGQDDIQFYENLANSISKEILVIAIENIKDYSEGCENVIKAIKSMQSVIVLKNYYKKYLLGIVDRDSRYFKNSIPNIECLFILKYYSYESHMANRKALYNIIQYITGVSQSMINEEVLRYVEKDLFSDFQELYYISLEALKFAVDDGYNNLVRYKDKAGKLFGENKDKLLSELYKKKKNLEIFANERNILIGDIKYIAKGKWYLHVYAKSTFKNIKTLHIACKNNNIEQCQYCRVGKFNKCLYKPKSNFQLGQILKLLLTSYDEEEVSYIKDRLRLLA